MAPRRADDRATYAVVGAQSPSGGRLRAALAERGVPGERVALYGIESEEAVLSEYDGEARLVQAVDADLVGAADVVFHCLPDPIPSLTDLPRIRARLVDLDGAVPDAALACDSLLPVPPEGPWRVPHGISVALYDAVREAQRVCLRGSRLPDCPTLVLMPLADPLVDRSCTTDWIRRAVPHAEVLELPGTRHEPHTDVGRDDVFRRIADWFDARTPGLRSG